MRNKDGEVYAAQTVINARSGLNRHLTGPPFNKPWCIMRDPEFRQANQIFKGFQRKNKEEGHDRTKRRATILSQEINRIYTNYFENNFDKDPVCLQHKVYFELSFFCGRRGAEGLKELQKDSFEICTSPSGVEYLQLTLHERTKKCQGEEYDPNKDENIISAQPDSWRCPIASFRLYMSKLSPKCNALFQQPNKNFKKDGASWYVAASVGKNAINSFMSIISKRAKLSRRFTNHCIRGTTATALKKSGFSIPEIASVTKHKNYQSLKHYLAVPDIDEKIKFSNALFKFGKNNGTEHEQHCDDSSDCQPFEEQMMEVTEDVSSSSSSDKVESELSSRETEMEPASNNNKAQHMHMKETANIPDGSIWTANKMDQMVGEMNEDVNEQFVEKTDMQQYPIANTNVSLVGNGQMLPVSQECIPTPCSISSNENTVQVVHEREVIRKRGIEPTPGMFVGSQLSNCSIHIHISQ